jgi:hypothetical protein
MALSELAVLRERRLLAEAAEVLAGVLKTPIAPQLAAEGRDMVAPLLEGPLLGRGSGDDRFGALRGQDDDELTAVLHRVADRGGSTLYAVFGALSDAVKLEIAPDCSMRFLGGPAPP